MLKIQTTDLRFLVFFTSDPWPYTLSSKTPGTVPTIMASMGHLHNLWLLNWLTFPLLAPKICLVFRINSSVRVRSSCAPQIFGIMFTVVEDCLVEHEIGTVSRGMSMLTEYLFTNSNKLLIKINKNINICN